MPKASFLIGAIATIAFYAAIAQEPLRGGTLSRYTTGHITEYVTVWLFLWGVADLVLRAMRLRTERLAIARSWLPPAPVPSPAADAGELHRQLARLPNWMQDSMIGRRLMGGVHYVREKRSAAGLEEHLRYLAELEAERSHGNYALTRFIAWMIPILGFLGTVVHFTLAIANVTPQQLETSLSTVTDGLGVAFDTTALALTLSMILMFFVFLTERVEQGILSHVEAEGHRGLAHRFKRDDEALAPVVAALQGANELTAAHVRHLIDRQTELWSATLADMQKRYADFTRHADARLLAVFESFESARATQAESLERTGDMVSALASELKQIGGQLSELLADQGKFDAAQARLADNLVLLQQTQRLDEAVNGLIAAISLLTIRRQPLASPTPQAA